jgi:hypothetical protein
MHPGRYDDRSHSRPAVDRRARLARYLPLLPAVVLTLAPSARADIARDRALLYALYHTSQDTGWDGLLQVSRIRDSQILSSGRKR